MIFVINYFYGNIDIFKLITFFNELYSTIPISFLRYFLFVCLTLLFIFICSIENSFIKNKIELKRIRKYVNDCKKLIKYNRNKLYNKNTYISICIAALNMEYFIERNLISILNQSFQNFEIIIVNDGSTDETENIIKRLQNNDKRIKILSHTQALGVYRSRIESILNSCSKNILLMDPDDIYLNENLFQELYDYNKNRNLDIIEFSVYNQFQSVETIFIPNNHFEYHYHRFNKNIIYQPELSQILYYLPNSNELSHTICRNIWNKMIKKEIFIKTNNYIGKEYYNRYIITSDDMLMNIISYQFANNYSNIDIPGYLYIKRRNSMSSGGNYTIQIIRAINYLYYFELFYKYIKDYNKDINILFHEMQNLQHFLLKIKKFNMTEYIPIEIKLIERIFYEKKISKDFKLFLLKLLKFLNFDFRN